MNKKRSKIIHIPSPRAPIVIGSIDEILLDLDFDDIDEMIQFEPPVRCVRGGRVLHLEKDDDDGEIEG
jgi:hypothetical protein